MLVHELIAREVSDTGATVMFGLLGDANLFTAHAFTTQNGGRFVAAAHESSAVMMAFGYACRTGGLGIATVTQGPGLSNAATALLEAVRSHVPVLLLTGDAAPSKPFHPQRLAQEQFVNATGAGYVLVESPKDVCRAVREAVARALAESRPYVLNCPTEFAWDEAGDPIPHVDVAAAVVAPVDDEVEEALGVVAMARRPLVLAGKGVTGDVQRTAVLRFAERIGAPIMTTLRARHLYSAAEGSLGVCGTVSTDVGVKAVMESDCIIAFGSSLNAWTSVRNTLFEGKRIVQVDIDRASFRPEATPVTAFVAGDAALVAERMTELADEAELSPSAFRARATEGVLDGDLVAHIALGERLDFGGALSTLNMSMPHPRTVVTDGGRFQGESFKYVWGTDHLREVQTTTYGAVGMGMGAAIGAAVAAPDEPTVLITGDGGFMMNGLAELHSAVRAEVPLIVVICNDSSYGAEYDQFVSRGLPPELSLFTWPDFVDVAAALGATGVAVTEPGDIEKAIAAMEAPSVPVVIDIRVAPDDVPEVPH